MVARSRSAKRERIVALLAEQPGASDRAIARLAGVSPTTVGRVRGESGQSAWQTGHPAKAGHPARVDGAETGQSMTNRSRLRQANLDTTEIGQGEESGHDRLDDGEIGYPRDQQQPGLVIPGLGDQLANDSDANGPVLEVLGVDVCECGGCWLSDGEGGRYCEDCGASHPKTPSVPFVLPPADERRAAVLAREIAEALGDARRLANMLPTVRDHRHHALTYHLAAAEVALRNLGVQ